MLQLRERETGFDQVAPPSSDRTIAMWSLAMPPKIDLTLLVNVDQLTYTLSLKGLSELVSAQMFSLSSNRTGLPSVTSTGTQSVGFNPVVPEEESNVAFATTRFAANPPCSTCGAAGLLGIARFA